MRELDEYLKTLRLQEKQLEDEEIIKQIRSLNTKDGNVMDVLRRVQNMNAPEPEVPDYNEREGMEYGE